MGLAEPGWLGDLQNGGLGDQGDLLQGHEMGAPHRLRLKGDWIKTRSQTISQSPNHFHRVPENEENQLWHTISLSGTAP